MAETATEISVPAAQPVAESTPQPGPSRTATVADESEEIAAETGVQVASAGSNGKEGEQQGDSVKTERKEGEEEEEKEEDPNRIPDNACETLYIQNLNEKVRLPGELCCPVLWLSCVDICHGARGHKRRERGGWEPRR